MKVYAKIVNDKIISIGGHPGWLDDFGNLVDDQILLGMGYVPVDYDANRPTEYDPFYQRITEKPYSEWTILKGDVVYKKYDPESGKFIEITGNIPYKVLVEYQVESLSIDEIKNRLKGEIYRGFYSSTSKFYWEEKQVTVNADFISIQRLKIRLEKSNDNEIIHLRCEDNSFIDITKTELSNLIEMLEKLHLDMLEKKWSKESELEQLNTIDELKNFIPWE